MAKWNSQSENTIYGDAAARVLCRIFKIEPGGRTLQQCLERTFISPNSAVAVQNALEGDGAKRAQVECKASWSTTNVCISAFELEHSKAVALLAWVPWTDEVCWATTMEEVRKSEPFWLSQEETFLVFRDKLQVL